MKAMDSGKCFVLVFHRDSVHSPSTDTFVPFFLPRVVGPHRGNLAGKKGVSEFLTIARPKADAA